MILKTALFAMLAILNVRQYWARKNKRKVRRETGISLALLPSQAAEENSRHFWCLWHVTKGERD
ncbi:hypothetical protein [Roseovarius phycicola]|uniref:Uncharacterized protein n=1 Tax=Roseovarius phycicola TaxID=3080976 RepID=A0ABZ2HM24_9RHOB